MDAQLKAKWIEALRSGEYEQGKHLFEADGAFCCLGVLCKVMGIPTVDNNGAGSWSAVEDVLPDRYKTASALATMNDSHTSFSEIADYIEKNL